MKLALPLLVFTFMLGGCDLFGTEEPDLVIEARGTVILASTGEPISGLNAVIISIPSPIGAVNVLASDQTDTEGRFAVRYQQPAPFGARPVRSYMIEVNARPYDDRYTAYGRPASPGGVYDFGVIELEER